MTDARTFIIVGASLAGAKAARRCVTKVSRHSDPAGRRTSAALRAATALEGVPPGQGGSRQGLRPRRALLRGARHRSPAVDARPGARCGGAQRSSLSTGERLAYDAALLATGAAPRRLTVPGSNLAGVLYAADLGGFRPPADRHTRRRAGLWSSAAVGSGARWLRRPVSWGRRSQWWRPARCRWSVCSDPSSATFYRDVHAEHGVEWHLGTGVEELRGPARAEEVLLADGTCPAAATCSSSAWA